MDYDSDSIIAALRGRRAGDLGERFNATAELITRVRRDAGICRLSGLFDYKLVSVNPHCTVWSDSVTPFTDGVLPDGWASKSVVVDAEGRLA